MFFNKNKNFFDYAWEYKYDSIHKKIQIFIKFSFLKHIPLRFTLLL